MGFHYSGIVLVASLTLLAYSGIDYGRSRKYKIDLAGYLGVIFSWLLFILAFVSDEFTLLAVYSYSTREMPVWLKIASSWAGMGGSFLLWTTFMALISLAYRLYGESRRVLDERVMRGYALSTLIVGVLTVEAKTFETVEVDFPILAGAGLNTLLRSFWILVHPLFTFAGYAFGIALALHVLLSRSKDYFWERLVAGLAWLNLSIGIIAGAVWAYLVLGWGGFWAWDPVETAELVPWLALTAYFHSFQSVGDGGRRLTAALVGFYTFYSSFMTKAGAQFTASVHTFEWSPSAVTLIASHFLAGGSILTLYLWRPGRFSWQPKRDLTSISFHIAWWSLVALSLISFMGIFTPVVYSLATGDLISVGVEYYNSYALPFVYLFLLGLVGCSLRSRVNTKEYLVIALTSIVISLASASLRMPTENFMANLLIPATLTVVVAASYKLFSDVTSKKLRSSSISLLHLSIPIILLGIALNTTLDSSVVVESRIGEPVETPYGATVVYEGYSIRVSDWKIFYSGHVIPEGAYGDFKFKVLIGDKAYTLTIPVWTPFLYGCGSEPKVISRGLDDIYLSIVHSDFHNRLREIIVNNAFYGGSESIDYVVVEVKYNPFIAVVWLGSTLLVASEALTIAVLFREKWRGGEK